MGKLDRPAVDEKIAVTLAEDVYKTLLDRTTSDFPTRRLVVQTVGSAILAAIRETRDNTIDKTIDYVAMLVERTEPSSLPSPELTPRAIASAIRSLKESR